MFFMQNALVPSDSIWFSVGEQGDLLDFSVSVPSCFQGRRQGCPSDTEAAVLVSVPIQKWLSHI